MLSYAQNPELNIHRSRDLAMVLPHWGIFCKTPISPLTLYDLQSSSGCQVFALAQGLRNAGSVSSTDTWNFLNDLFPVFFTLCWSHSVLCALPPQAISYLTMLFLLWKWGVIYLFSLEGSDKEQEMLVLVSNEASMWVFGCLEMVCEICWLKFMEISQMDITGAGIVFYIRGDRLGTPIQLWDPNTSQQSKLLTDGGWNSHGRRASWNSKQHSHFPRQVDWHGKQA